MSTNHFDLIIVGYGPAGLASCIQAHAAGFRKILVVDPSPLIGSAGLTGIGIESNSTGNDFTAPWENVYKKALQQDSARPLQGVSKTVPLSVTVPFFQDTAHLLLEDDIATLVAEHVLEIAETTNGFIVNCENSEFTTPRIILTMGGKERILDEFKDRGSKVFTSREVFTGSRNEELERFLAEYPHVGIVGNSHSAIALAEMFVRTQPDVKVNIYRRSPTKPYFDSRADAEAAGYIVTPKDSVCPDTGKINREDGVRGPANRFYLRERNGEYSDQVANHLNIPHEEIDGECALIQAIGYEGIDPPFVGTNGSPMKVTEQPTRAGYSIIKRKNGEQLLGAITLGIGHSKRLNGKPRDATNFYQEQAAQGANELLRVG